MSQSRERRVKELEKRLGASKKKRVFKLIFDPALFEEGEKNYFEFTSEEDDRR